MSHKARNYAASAVTPKRLLIADSNKLLRRACRRYFEGHFYETIECDSLRAVDSALYSATSSALICGVFEGAEPNSARIRRWKALNPALSGVVLIAGTLELPHCTDADLVLGKPFDPRAVLQVLFPERTQARETRPACPLGGAT